jgi:hypothetical protein
MDHDGPAMESAGGEAVAGISSVTDADFGERFVSSAVDNFGALDRGRHDRRGRQGNQGR